MTSVAAEVTVVVCTHNRRVWLEQCVLSVLGQQGVSFDVVVVDDASSDDTMDWLRTVSDPRLKVVHLAESSEKSAARNRGLAETSGQYVMFLDDDDWLWPGALCVLAAGLRSHDLAVAAVGARWVWFTAEDYQRRDAHPRNARVRNIMPDLLADWSAVSGQNLFRAAEVRRVGGYDRALNLCEDRDLWLRLAQLGPVVLCPEVVVTYRVHQWQLRPPDIRRIRERVARKAIRALPRRKRRHALRLRRTAALLDRAEDALSVGRVHSGVTYTLRALANTPAIFLSPLVGEWVLRRLAGRFARRFIRPSVA